jgi:hypothetical protein
VTDWRRNKESLLGNSEPILRALSAENRDRGDVVAAVGYVFEFGRGPLCFERCAKRPGTPSRRSRSTRRSGRTPRPMRSAGTAGTTPRLVACSSNRLCP